MMIHYIEIQNFLGVTNLNKRAEPPRVDCQPGENEGRSRVGRWGDNKLSIFNGRWGKLLYDERGSIRWAI